MADVEIVLQIPPSFHLSILALSPIHQVNLLWYFNVYVYINVCIYMYRIYTYIYIYIHIYIRTYGCLSQQLQEQLKGKTFALNFDFVGCFQSFSRSVFRWKTYIIQQWEYSSRPSRDAGGTRAELKTKHALARGTSKGCLGVPFLNKCEVLVHQCDF